MRWLGPAAWLLACQQSPAPPVPQAPEPPAVVLAGAAAGAHALDVDHLVRVYDDPARDSWQRPDAVIGAMAIAPGATVADVGAGTGYFTSRLAQAVGPTGKVVAVEIEPALIAHLEERAATERTPQVEARLGRPDDPLLKPGEIDRVLLVDTYRYIADRRAWFGALAPALKPDGRLFVVEFLPGTSPHGPPAADRVDPEAVVEEVERAGWSLVGRPDLLPEQYVLVFAVR